MKKLTFIVILFLSFFESYSQGAIVVMMAPGASSTCTVNIAMAGSSSCTPVCACDYSTNRFILTPGTTYLWADAYDVESGYALGWGPGWSTGASMAGSPPSIPTGWRWAEARFSIDCGGGVTCAADMINPPSNNCAGTGTAIWSGCGLNGSYSSGSTTVISFW